MSRVTALKCVLYTQYTITHNYAAVPELSLTIPEDGYYLVFGSINLMAYDSAGGEAQSFIKLAIDGTRIVSGAALRLSITGLLSASIPIMHTLYLTKDTVITVHAKDEGDDESAVYGSSNAATSTYIEALKVG
jgi:hypothetical protein